MRRLLVAFGGRSSEHEISVRSATEVLAALDRTTLTPIPLGIRRDGSWWTGPSEWVPQTVLEHGDPVVDLRALGPDVVFPLLHGPHGEDGSFQGLLEVLGLPYVGSGVLASALCMDKGALKHFLRAAAPEVPLVPWLELRADRADDPDLAGRVAETLGFPCFVKASRLGSSIGVYRVADAAGLDRAIRSAAEFDDKILIEQAVDAREIEVAVLGDGGPDTVVSAPGEIELPRGTWYDYDAKYESDVAILHVPAELPAIVAERVRAVALEAFRSADCRGLARIDFLLDRRSGTAYLNEINTLPGFTTISMYPKLMGHAGIGYARLVDRLCELGLAEFRRANARRHDRGPAPA